VENEPDELCGAAGSASAQPAGNGRPAGPERHARGLADLLGLGGSDDCGNDHGPRVVLSVERLMRALEQMFETKRDLQSAHNHYDRAAERLRLAQEAHQAAFVALEIASAEAKSQ
jgi:hypothetical protein